MVIKKCACGCARKIVVLPHHKYVGVPDYLKGHFWKNKKRPKEFSENMSGRNHPMYGKKHTEETKRKMKEAGNLFKKGHSTWNKGKKMSRKFRKKCRERQLGKPNPNKGKTWKEIHGKEKAKKLRKKHTKRLKQNPPDYWKGKKRSRKTKKKISDSLRGREGNNKGKKFDKKWKENISKGRRGISMPEDAKRKISAALKQQYENGRVIWNKGRGREIFSEEALLKLKRLRAKQKFPLQDSSIERKMQEMLKKIGLEFETHCFVDIEDAYLCDIFISELNLVIECDGDYWHNYPNGKPLDHARTKQLQEKGFKVLRLWEREINIMDEKEIKKRIESCLEVVV